MNARGMSARDRVQRAKYRLLALPLSGEWAHKVAKEKFGAELMDELPRILRGRDQRRVRGLLCFIKTEVGGWAENLPGGRGVLFPGTSDWKLAIADQHSDPHGHSVIATWDRQAGARVFQTWD